MNCKPGDLAIMIKCPDFPENIGIVVEVLRAEDRSRACDCPVCAMPAWECVSRSRPFLGRIVFGPIAILHQRTQTAVPDDWLRPIPGEHEVEAFDRTIDQPLPETVS